MALSFTTAMRLGEVIADRFELEHLAGSGGMGRVYLAKDITSGAPVALKLLHAHTSYESARFTREAMALAALDQERIPGVVRYIAHGATPDEDLYLVMEWLSGETLAERLSRALLTVAESITLTRHVALALGAVHRRGYVHRDLKPSNIFLGDGLLDKVTLIDFGIARLPNVDHDLTVPGTMLGTPAFIAPEQARSAIEVDARADIFSLGCVLFKCLTGQAPFTAKDGISVLLRVVLEDAPRLRSLRRDVPAALDALVARMLSKEPKGRPGDGELAALELAALSEITSSRPSTIPPEDGGQGLEITTAERRVMCLVLAREIRAAHDISVTPPERPAHEQALRAAVAKQKGELEILADGSIFVLQQHAGTATDLAAQAARSALAMRALLIDVPIAVVTGRGVPSSRRPIGELIDGAFSRLIVAPASGSEIRLDEVTAGLLGAEFDVGEGEAGLCLRGARDALDAPRTLLGKPTPFVGRERERSQIVRAFDRTATESEASVVLVKGAPGMGKSRLGHEFLREIRGTGQPVEIWIARGDPMSAGSAFGLLGQALRRALGVLDGEPIEERRKKLSARVARHAWSAPEQARIAGYLGELIGSPFPEGDGTAKRVVHHEAGVIGDQMRRAFEDFLAAECAAQPVLFLLEDLHWGDLPTVKFIDGALGRLKEKPLMVLGLGRPEVADLFPKLWEEHCPSTIELAGLPRRAAERLVKETLGDAVTPGTASALIERAEGNAFYLEELIRATSRAASAALPETVLAMIQARLEALSVEARRALRAASIFGQTFWEGGVRALVGSRDISPWFAELVEAEICASRREGRFPDEAEYTFRHSLLQEAAYAMLTEADRALGHKLAGAWLERRGEGRAMVLAEHFERGADLSRAATCYRRAAEQAFEGSDLSAVLTRADRGVACVMRDPSPEKRELGELYTLKARAHRWRGENVEALASAEAAVRSLRRGGAAFCDAMGEVILASGKLGKAASLMAASRTLLDLGDDVPISSSRVIALTRASVALRLTQRPPPEEVEALLERAADLALWVQSDPTVRAELLSARATRALAAGDVGDYVRLVEASRASYEEAGDLRNTCVRSLNLGYAHLQLGAFAAAEGVLRGALSTAERLGQMNMLAYARHNLGLSLGRQGKFAEARAVEEEAIVAFRGQQDRRMEAASRVYLAMILRLSGAFAEAEQEALRVAENPATPASLVATALSTMADAILSSGSARAAEALALSRRAMAILRELGGVEDGESLIRLVYAETLSANGDLDRARQAVWEAQERLLLRAEKVGEAELRESFLENVPENARTLSLAELLFRD